MTKVIAVQSDEFREKVISTFCKYLSYSALASVLLYLFLKLYVLCALTGGIGLFFLYLDRLNRKGYYELSRYAIIGMTALGVLGFSLLLGYNSGIYLYLFITPLLVHLLFDYEKKHHFIISIGIYLAIFLVVFNLKNEQLSWALRLTSDTQSLLYAFNFTSTIVLSFVLVSFMARKNLSYIKSIKEQREQLEQEIERSNKQEQELIQNVKEREVLLSEIHHRVRNNLAVVIGLINLKQGKNEDQKACAVLEEIKNKIYAMSLVHNLLYTNGSFETINLKEFLDIFCSNLGKSYDADHKIELIENVEGVDLSIHMAIPLALLLNELITNAYKHAFVGIEKGQITVSVNKIDTNIFKVQVSDNGVGMSEEKWKEENSGLHIAKSLAEQLESELVYSAENGSKFTLTIKRNQR